MGELASAARTAPSGPSAGVDSGATQQWLRLTAAGASYALPIDHVREIMQVGRLTPLPRLPEVIRGVMNLRGAVVPVIDLGARLADEPVTVGRRSCIVVVELNGLVAGAMVDAVYAVVDVDPADVSAAPPLGTRIAPEFLVGIVQVQGELVHLLDIERVLAAAALTELVAAHAA